MTEPEEYILKQKDWVKIWEFHHPVWFLDKFSGIHIKFNDKLGFENKNTIHVFENEGESAYFLQGEIDKLNKLRLKKILSKEYMNDHYLGALQAIKDIKSFFINLNKKDVVSDFFEYSELLDKLVSFYRASRPEIFEIVQNRLDKSTDKDEINYLNELIAKYGNLRLEINKVFKESENKAIKLKESIAIKLNITSKELGYLKDEEINNLIHTKSDPKKIIEERKKCIIGIIEGKKILIIGKDFERIKKHLSEKIVKTDLITGKTAFPGIVKGKVRVVTQTNKEEMIKKLNKIMKEEIFVTGMTQPEFIYAIKKAGAIVTDEGGITSHAAVISREFKIPCIINTKIATKILKDGDLVEVDANKGVVKILERAK